MRMSNRLIGGAFVLAIAAAGCSSAAATPVPATPAPATPAPATAAPASAAASAAPAPPVVITSGNAVEAKPVGAIGTVLVAGNNSMTVYTFAKDAAGAASACTGGCITKWPALTVASAALAVGGTGVTGALGTIMRADSGQLQVTYKGLPLYFFSGDKAPGDSNGVYTNWAAVTP
jgi:predicted lipoprotein with Yx(FWY)xxD motif